MWSGKNVVVTGGSGFIGSAITRALVAEGASVTVADLHPFPDDLDVRSAVGDLTEAANVDKAIEPGTDVVFHMAAFTSVLKSLENPAQVYRTNVAMTAALMERAREVGAGNFLFGSTNAVVGDVGGETITAQMPLRPLTPYGATKAAAEMLLSAYGASYGMKTSVLRMTNVYGPGMSKKDSIVPRLMRAALAGEGIQIYGDGTQIRDYVHVSDVVRGFLKAAEAGLVGPAILGSGRSVSVNYIVEAAREVTGAELPATHVPAKAGEMPAVVVDIAPSEAAIGYEPTLTLEQGLATAWDDFRRNNASASTNGRVRG